MTWVKTQGVFTNKPGHKSWLVSKSRSESRCRSTRWWLAPTLSSEYHNRTDICFTNTRNYCHRNKIYVLTCLLKQIYLQSTECARIYCTVNTVCHSCYHHREFTSRRTHGASYQIRKIAGCACAGNAGNVFPRRRFQRKLLVSDPGMHHSTCVTHVLWCMSGSLTCGDGENVPGIPGACAPAILRIW